MQSRKSGSSEMTLSDSHRSSLKRLSSIASFQNLFTRRRSNNVTDHDAAAQSSSSNLSISSSTLVNAPEPAPKDATTSTSNLLQHEDVVTELPPRPQPSHQPSRRSSYICLPDDPIGGMPRSRTFSNLPLPTRAKKTANMVPSKSHARLPSALLPSTRLPSPPMSTRKHSHTRLMSAENKPPPTRNRMKRSDTEPLLGINAQQQPNHLPRSTAFKENISLSPIKQLPALDMSHYRNEDTYSSSSPYHHSRLWKESTSSEASEPLPFDSISSSPPLSGYAHHPALQIVRGCEYKSSPAYRSSRERPPTPGTSALDPIGMQRWNSQPVLTNILNNRPRGDSHRNSDIKQTRLLSTRQAPTPPPPKTPLASYQTLPAGKVKASNNSAKHIHPASEQTPTPPTQTSASTTSIHQISHPEPIAYWAGRLSALADRYRNEELLLHLSAAATGNISPKAQTDKMHTPEAATARIKRALEYLHICCVTSEAERSLMVFQGRFAEVMRMPECKPKCLQLSLQGGDGMKEDRGGGGECSGAEMRMSESRKVSFMDRLLGRQGGKRRSLVLA